MTAAETLPLSRCDRCCAPRYGVRAARYEVARAVEGVSETIFAVEQLCGLCRQTVGAELVAPGCSSEPSVVDLAVSRVHLVSAREALCVTSPADAARAWLGTAAPSPADTELRRMVRGLLLERDALVHQLRAHAELFLDALDAAMDSRDASVERASDALQLLRDLLEAHNDAEHVSDDPFPDDLSRAREWLERIHSVIAAAEGR